MGRILTRRLRQRMHRLQYLENRWTGPGQSVLAALGTCGAHPIWIATRCPILPERRPESGSRRSGPSATGDTDQAIPRWSIHSQDEWVLARRPGER